MNHTPGPWKEFIQGRVIEVQDRDGNAVIPWTGFDDSNRTQSDNDPYRPATVKIYAAFAKARGEQ